ncbi:hypothetical protein DID77_03245 [Candidatus Marinamargulisbacteria bacterium SCGC AG-439-L15]|nr:hypothetical protein DID77_03245 [Candidatus Marinamargulisbacteria bacterium SCGC AG-439-L15]
MKKFLFILLFIVSLYEPSLAKKDALELKSSKINEHFIFESYIGNNDGLESLIGYYYDYFLSERVFIALGTSWAIVGNHGGYGTALIGLGYAHPLQDNLFLDLKVFTGAGGHILIDAGGGGALAWQLGMNYKIIDPLILEVRYGGLQFPSGGYEVNTLGIGVSYLYGLLFL